MHPITAEYYGIPPERVVGSAVGLSYDADKAEVALRECLRRSWMTAR